MRIFISIILGLFLVTAANAADFVLKSTGFSDNGKIPALYSCDGQNISPQLSWDNVPANTQSFVLILASPDWSAGSVYFWTLYNIPSNIKSLPQAANQDLPQRILVGTNYYNETNYHGPCPPDNLVHHYVFTLYALDSTLDLPDGADPSDVLIKSKNHILKQTQLTGVFSH